MARRFIDILRDAFKDALAQELAKYGLTSKDLEKAHQNALRTVLGEGANITSDNPLDVFLTNLPNTYPLPDTQVIDLKKVDANVLNFPANYPLPNTQIIDLKKVSLEAVPQQGILLVKESILRNPSFETGDLAGWKTEGIVSIVVNDVLIEVEGKYSCKLNPGAKIRQTIPPLFIPQLIIVLWAKAEVSGDSVTIKIKRPELPDVTYTTSLTTTWKKIVYTFPLLFTFNNLAICFEIEAPAGNSGAIYVDSIFLFPIPLRSVQEEVDSGDWRLKIRNDEKLANLDVSISSRLPRKIEADDGTGVYAEIHRTNNNLNIQVKGDNVGLVKSADIPKSAAGNINININEDTVGLATETTLGDCETLLNDIKFWLSETHKKCDLKEINVEATAAGDFEIVGGLTGYFLQLRAFQYESDSDVEVALRFGDGTNFSPKFGIRFTKGVLAMNLINAKLRSDIDWGLWLRVEGAVKVRGFVATRHVTYTY